MEKIMANITRFNPFSKISRMDPLMNLDDWFPEFSLRPVLRNIEVEPQIKLDVSEEDKSYVVKAEIPGVKKEDIHVQVEGNRVAISAEVRKEKEEKEGRKLISSERYFGKVFRSFMLDQDVDAGGAQAKYTDGMLELTLPKKAGSKTQEITIS